MQIRYRKTGQCRHRSGTSTSGSLIPNFPTRTGGRTWVGGNGGGMVVGLYLDLDVIRRINVYTISGLIFSGYQYIGWTTFNDCCVIVISHDGVLGCCSMGLSNQTKETIVERLTIQRPTRIKNFVAAMLRVGLSKHHQFCITGSSSHALINGHQILHFIIAERQTQTLILL